MGATEEYDRRVKDVVEVTGLRRAPGEPTGPPDFCTDEAVAANVRSFLLSETCLSLAEAARLLPKVRGGKPLHPSTLFRWASQGRKSKSGRIVRLEVIKIGGTNCTSIEALNRFIDRINDIEPVDPPKPRSQVALEKQAKEAKRILRHRGLVK